MNLTNNIVTCGFTIRWGDWNRENGHRETIKIVGTDIARLDNAGPDNVAPDQTEVYNFYAAWNIRPIW